VCLVAAGLYQPSAREAHRHFRVAYADRDLVRPCLRLRADAAQDLAGHSSGASAALPVMMALAGWPEDSSYSRT
jgi:hypothetical protein